MAAILAAGGNMPAAELTLPADNTAVEVAAPLKYVSNRPAVGDRLFTSQAVENEIVRIKNLPANAKLAWMFGNCFPNTLDTTVRYRQTDLLNSI